MVCLSVWAGLLRQLHTGQTQTKPLAGEAPSTWGGAERKDGRRGASFRSHRGGTPEEVP